MEKYTVVIPAAGQGKRMGAGKNKQFILIGQTPLLIHTLRVFEEDLLCQSIVLVCNKEEVNQMQELIADFNITKVDAFVPGGKERQQSVFEGLKVIKGNPVVLIHDGARPFVNQKTIHALLQTVVSKGAAVAATPVKDTIKKGVNGMVDETIDRSSLWAVQTPQAFRYEEIIRAHKMAEVDRFLGTDDASLVEYIGEKVYIVEGNYENIKVTTPEDLLFGEAIIFSRKGEKK